MLQALNIMSRSLLAHILFSALTSGLMSALVCCVATIRVAGAVMNKATFELWAHAWVAAWPVAFAVLVCIGPIVRKTIYKSCKCPLAMPKDPSKAHLVTEAANAGYKP